MTTSSSAQRYTPCKFLEQRDEIATEVVSRLFAADPALHENDGPFGVNKYREDIARHIRYLGESVAAQSPELYRNYIDWVDEVSNGVGISTAAVRYRFETIAEVLRERDYFADADAGVEFLEDAIARLGTRRDTAASPLVGAAAIAPPMLDALLACRRSEAVQLLDDAVSGGMPITDIYLKVFQPVLREVGRLWQVNAITVAQEHFCSAAIQLMMGRLASQIFATERNGRTIVLACVGQELHEIGLRMVADILELSGWRTNFLGANVPTPDLVSMVRTTGADMLCLSATLTSHLSKTNDVILAIRNEPDLANVKVVVGGYPFNVQPGLWRTVGADGHAVDAADAAGMCANLVEQ